MLFYEDALNISHLHTVPWKRCRTSTGAGVARQVYYSVKAEDEEAAAMKSKLDHRVSKGPCESRPEVSPVKFLNRPTSTTCYLHYHWWLVVVQVSGNTAGWSLVAVTILLPDVVVVVVVGGSSTSRLQGGGGVEFRAVT